MPKRVTIVPQQNLGAFGEVRVLADGRVLYPKYVEGKAAIHIANADGTGERRISFGVWDFGTPLLSPDGRWVAFARDAGGQSDAVVVALDSAVERIAAGTVADERPTGWLADGSLLVIVSGAAGGQPFRYDMANGSLSPLFAVRGSVDAYPSPDGKLVAYQLTLDGKNTLWAYDLAAKAHRQLTTEGFERINARPFSPDGKYLAYQSTRTGTSDMWRLEMASGDRLQLTADIAEDNGAVWAPDSKRLAFVSQRGGQPDIWVLGAGESDIQRITDDAVAEYPGAWTPDGSAIYVSASRGNSHLYSIPSDAGAPSALTSGDWGVLPPISGGGPGYPVDISRDGQQVAYAGNANGDPDVWAVNVAGGAPRLIAGGPSVDVSPSWSPDGRSVAFASTRSGNPDVWIAPVDSGAPRQVTDWQGADFSPQWSPTGDLVAFVSDRDAPVADLWVASAIGGAPRRLTTLGSVQPFHRWSPDGKWLLFTAASPGGKGPGAYVVPASGGAPRQIGPVPSIYPTWSPDGREVLLHPCRQGYCNTEIWSFEGKFARALSTDSVVYEFVAAASPDASTVAIARQDLTGDGSDVMHLRPAGGGPPKVLPRPPGYSMNLIGWAAGGRALIAIGSLYGAQVQRITVPPPRQ